MSLEEYNTERIQKWYFSGADWEKFKIISEQEMEKIDIYEDVDKYFCL